MVKISDYIESNTDDYSNTVLTLSEWWGEGDYGYKKIYVLYNGNVLLEERNIVIKENGTKEEIINNQNVTILDKNELTCLKNIIEFINTNFNEQETPMICDYGVEVIINCGPLNICIENEINLYRQLINILNIFIEKNKTNCEINYSSIEKEFIKEYLSELNNTHIVDDSKL